MQFTKIRLNGFKSFVDPTEMVIAEGLTGIVGPNGCGKSNLLEALRWVMGENRPTAMRGDGMEDVIFAGTARRPPRNYAEVALSIDNSERLAPTGFNDSDVLDIARRITRDAGSAYKVNQKDVRARDVQMLFADASTGAHSPALVRQGQISELINAKPKARRRILEEAAGISGLYQRRHEAELKLKGAEGNLARVDDVIEQLAAQLAALARQARQAARYRALSEELRQAEGTLLFLRWREADAARLAAETELREKLTAAVTAERLAREAVAARETAEGAVPPLREEAAIAAAVLQRLNVRRDQLQQDEERAAKTIETLVSRIAQLGRDVARETELGKDAAGTIERLQEEAQTLESASKGHAALLEEAEGAAREAAQILQDREADFARETEDLARLSARHQSAQRLRDDAVEALKRGEAEAGKARATAEAAKTTEAEAATAMEEAKSELESAARAAEAAEKALAHADESRGHAQAHEAEARAGRSEAEGELNALRAEMGALARLVDRDTTEGGQVLDLLRVDQGFEKALGASLADDLKAPAIDGADASGWARLPGYDSAQPLPNGIRSLADHMTVPDVLARRLSQVGLVERAEGAARQAELLPGQRLVSREGDLWRWDGFRAGADSAPSAAALRLQQVNRLEELKAAVAEAEERADNAASTHEAQKARLARVTEADREARDMRREADTLLAQANRAYSRAEAAKDIAAGRRETAEQSARRHDEEASQARVRMREAETAMAALDDLDAARLAMEGMKEAVEAARLTMITRRSGFDEIRREGEDRDKRLAQIRKEVTGWTDRAANAGSRIAELEARLAEDETSLVEAREVPSRLASEREKLGSEIASAEARQAAADDALAGAERALRAAVDAERQAERFASEAREQKAAYQARTETARAAVQAARERIAEDQEATPEELAERLGDMPDNRAASAVEADVARIKRQRDALGAVNLRAEEDAREVQEEHDGLVSEKADLEAAIRTLRNGIQSLNREGRERLLTAFEQVNSNFGMLFTHLFGGGEARLVMIESDDPLEAGLEILCQPPGKKLASLGLLSGGEQTLTALALIFAVFISNPAPICVLDEVDAPLDDANVGRFCDMLDEMTRRTDTRYLIITHHAVTMSRMDRLFGVTMGEQGVSQLVSVDLRKAEALVA